MSRAGHLDGAAGSKIKPRLASSLNGFVAADERAVFRKHREDKGGRLFRSTAFGVAFVEFDQIVRAIDLVIGETAQKNLRNGKERHLCRSCYKQIDAADQLIGGAHAQSVFSETKDGDRMRRLVR